MKAITIRPPWSWAIAETAALTALNVTPKTVENRGRPVAAQYIGADIAIHAGRAWCPVGGGDPRVIRAWTVFAAAIGLREANPLLAAHGDTRTGAVGALTVPNLWIGQGEVVAVATLTGCHEATVTGRKFGTEPCCQPWGDRTYNDGTAWHLILGNVRRLAAPVPARGAISVPWTLPDDVAAQVTAQLTAAAPTLVSTVTPPQGMETPL